MPPQPNATAFAFASVSILLLCFQSITDLEYPLKRQYQERFYLHQRPHVGKIAVHLISSREIAATLGHFLLNTIYRLRKTKGNLEDTALNSDVDLDPQGTSSWETTWIRIRMEDTDLDPRGKKIAENGQKKCRN